MRPFDGEFIGLISDGNRRHQRESLCLDARSEDLPDDVLRQGYELGAESVKQIITVSREEAVGIIAPWGMSEGNMESRTLREKHILYSVFGKFLRDLRDDWMRRPENAGVRFAHLGRRDRLDTEAPGVMALIDEIEADTRDRTQMLVAVCLDYGGPEEFDRAMRAWKAAGYPGDIDGWQAYTDLARKGVGHRELDLRVRTGDKGPIKHANEYLRPYSTAETRDIFPDAHLPAYGGDAFRADLREYRRTERRKGK